MSPTLHQRTGVKFIAIYLSFNNCVISMPFNNCIIFPPELKNYSVHYLNLCIIIHECRCVTIHILTFYYTKFRVIFYLFNILVSAWITGFCCGKCLRFLRNWNVRRRSLYFNQPRIWNQKSKLIFCSLFLCVVWTCDK